MILFFSAGDFPSPTGFCGIFFFFGGGAFVFVFSSEFCDSNYGPKPARLSINSMHQ